MSDALSDYLGYCIYFWISNEEEPIHVHVCKTPPQRNATKFWITKNGVELAKDTGSVDKKDMGKILRYLRKNRLQIIERWINHFGKTELKR